MYPTRLSLNVNYVKEMADRDGSAAIQKQKWANVLEVFCWYSNNIIIIIFY